MLRGGSWNNNARNCRSANRNRNEPDNRNNNVGFRVCLPLHFRSPLAGGPSPGRSTDRPAAGTEVLGRDRVVGPVPPAKRLAVAGPVW